MTAVATFQLIILKQRWSDLKLGYRAPDALRVLAAIGDGDGLYVAAAQDLDVYDWDRQTLTLTSDATAALMRALADQGSPPDGVKAIVEMRSRLGWGNRLESALYTRCFVVNVDGALIYGGIFLDATSQMGIDYPVARVTVVDDRAVTALLPVHIPFVVTDPVTESGAWRDASIATEAQADVRQLDAHGDRFANWIRGVSTTGNASEFRALIRDPRIKGLLETAGKLKE